METEISHQAEEYLEAIYKLQSKRGVAKTTELANALNVVPGSVTNTIQHLKKRGLIKHEPYKGTSLTAKGEEIALNILRKHRLAERLLTDILNAKWSNVHENACKLEHALTKEVIMLLDKKLGYPKFCPHGNPIPSEKGKIQEEECCPLTEASIAKAYVVTKITDEEREKLLILASEGITPGVEIRVIERKPFNNIVLYVNEKKVMLEHNIASSVCVKNLENTEYASQKETVI